MGHPHIGFLFTRYPVLSEQFLHRELVALKTAGLHFSVLTLWPSKESREDAFNPSDAFNPWELLSLFYWIPYWVLRKPRAMTQLAAVICGPTPPNWLNLWENLLGMGYALVRARQLDPHLTHLHAIWASAPATAAWTLHLLTGLPYSLAGHAYDLFEDGGDWLLPVKSASAAFVRTSTAAGKRRWQQLGLAENKIHLIRRGVDAPAPLRNSLAATSAPTLPYRFLAVGRLVEKMDYPYLLDLAVACKHCGLKFRIDIIGEGPLRQTLERRRNALGLRHMVRFLGALPHYQVIDAYAQADLFVFTGTTARNGDRPGFPNAIGEAMAAGLTVCARPSGAVPEALMDGFNAIILHHPARDAIKISSALNNPLHLDRLRRNSLRWIQHHFICDKNMLILKQLLCS